MQRNLFNGSTKSPEPTKEDLLNIDWLIKNYQVDDAYNKLVAFNIPLSDILKRIVRLNFIPFSKGMEEFEDDGVHPFCRFTMFGKVFKFYESVGGSSGVLLDIGQKELGRVMWIEGTDGYDNNLRTKMNRNFTLFLFKNWISIIKEFDLK